MRTFDVEYIVNDNGVKFLNFWDSLTGNDIACEVKDGKLYMSQHEYNEETKEAIELPPKEITFEEFFKMLDARKDELKDFYNKS